MGIEGDNLELPMVTVITLTQAHTEFLDRALRSIVDQDFLGGIEHIIIGDDCPKLIEYLEQIRHVNPAVIVRNVHRPRVNEYLPARLARLRNLGVDLASGQYIAYLDDDNEFVPNHLSSLVSKLEASELDIVHSYRLLRNRDGTPYKESLFPWSSSPQEAREIYGRFVEVGILSPGSDVMRDKMFTGDFPEFRVSGTVDLGEILIPSELHRRIRFPTNFSYEERKHGLMEDNKLLTVFVDNKLRIGTTAEATLIYYLGGYSKMLRSGNLEV